MKLWIYFVGLFVLLIIQSLSAVNSSRRFDEGLAISMFIIFWVLAVILGISVIFKIDSVAPYVLAWLCLYSFAWIDAMIYSFLPLEWSKLLKGVLSLLLTFSYLIIVILIASGLELDAILVEYGLEIDPILVEYVKRFFEIF